MKNIALIIFLLGSLLVKSQDIELTIEANKDSMGIEDLLKVKFSVNTTDNIRFFLNEIPNFEIINNQTSTSISIINGQKTEEQSWTFYLKPLDVGTFNIEDITLMYDTEEYRFQSIEVVVLNVPTYGDIKEEKMDNYNHFFFSPKPKKAPKQTPTKRKHQTKRL